MNCKNYYESIEDFYKDNGNWDMENLWKLREEIVLGSIYYNDYENSFDIPKELCLGFFDGFIDLCFFIESDSGNTNADIEDIYNKYDNKESLWNYFCSLEEYPF